MKRRTKLAVAAGILLAAMCLAAPREAQAGGGWSFSFYSGGPSYAGYGGGYGPGYGCRPPVCVPPPPPPPCFHPAPVYRYRAYYGPYGYRGPYGNPYRGW